MIKILFALNLFCGSIGFVDKTECINQINYCVKNAEPSLSLEEAYRKCIEEYYKFDD